MLRFKLEDLPPRMRLQAERTLAQDGKPRAMQRNPQDERNTEASPSVTKRRKVRPPITMAKKNEQSSAERQFNAEFLGNRGKFEALTLHLPGGAKYTPDFLMKGWLSPSDLIMLFEVKGSYRLQSHSRAATAFKTSCAVYPEFVFCWAEQQKTKGIWKVTTFRNGGQESDCCEGTAEEVIQRLMPLYGNHINQPNNQPNETKKKGRCQEW